MPSPCFSSGYPSFLALVIRVSFQNREELVESQEHKYVKQCTLYF